MAIKRTTISKLQTKIWNGSLPLEIHLSSSDCRTYDGVGPYLINIPRLSYLPLLLPRLHSFFNHAFIDPNTGFQDSWFEFQDVALKWHYPVGLLFDLFSGALPCSEDDAGLDEHIGDGAEGPEGAGGLLPWKLTFHVSGLELERVFGMDGEGRVIRDCFVNGVKEADVIRNGKGHVFMGLSKSDSDSLWESVRLHDLPKFNSINNKLLNAPGVTLRSIPMKIYLPTAPVAGEEGETQKGSIRTVQSLVPPLTPSRQQNTLGMALNTILPTVFPSRRNPVLATPVMHGAVVPMNAPVEELMRAAAYADGFLHIAVIMLS